VIADVPEPENTEVIFLRSITKANSDLRVGKEGPVSEKDNRFSNITEGEGNVDLGHGLDLSELQRQANKTREDSDEDDDQHWEKQKRQAEDE
jgi:hypothetical protein